MPHILRTSTEHITAPLVDEGNYAYCQSRGAHNIKHNTYNLCELALRGYLNTDARTRDRKSELFYHKNDTVNARLHLYSMHMLKLLVQYN